MRAPSARERHVLKDAYKVYFVENIKVIIFVKPFMRAPSARERHVLKDAYKVYFVENIQNILIRYL
jgi:hypothetical protein